MSDLTDFLLAQIAEDEAHARTLEGSGWFQVEDFIEAGLAPRGFRHGSGASIVEDKYSTGRPPSLSAGERYARMVQCAHEHRVRGQDRRHCPLSHVIRHDPARVVADCEARKKAVALYAHVDGPDGDDWAQVAWHFLCVLASRYADHPDYREEWRP